MPVDLDNLASVLPTDPHFLYLKPKPGHLLLKISILHLLDCKVTYYWREYPQRLFYCLEGCFLPVGGHLKEDVIGKILIALALVLLEQDHLVHIHLFVNVGFFIFIFIRIVCVLEG